MDPVRIVRQRERATRASWRTMPIPARIATIPVDISCTVDEFERLKYGFVPQEMEDHSFVFVADRTAHFHRSWTGFWNASLAFSPDGNRFIARMASVNRDRSQYSWPDEIEEARAIEGRVNQVIDANEGCERWFGRSSGIEDRPALDTLVKDQAIRMSWSDALLRSPQPLPDGFSFDRVEGMLLGLAIGDALGNSTEGLNPGERPVIEGYRANPYAGGRPVGTPSDDTQLAFWTLEQLVADGGLDPARLARRLSCQRIFGIGRTVRQFISNFKASGEWLTAGEPSAGNGALMRIAPVIVPHLRNPTPALWADAAIASMITHNDRASNASCVAFVDLLWNALTFQTPPATGWWTERFTGVATPLEGKNNLEPRFGRWKDRYRGPLAGFVRLVVAPAVDQAWSIREACDAWGSGAFLLETVPSALYILERHADDPREAILRAVNDTRDNDTIAAIVGAAVGALHGKGGLPAEWIEGLLGRTAEDDDGYAFDLIERARRRYWNA